MKIHHHIPVALFFVGLQVHLAAAEAGQHPATECRAVMINVNSAGIQGDAHLIQATGGKTILLDTGFVSYSDTELIPALKRHGVQKIDALFITHPHLDHYGGALQLLKSGIKVETIYMDPVSPEWFTREWWGGKADDIDSIRQEAAKLSIPIQTHDSWSEYKLSDKFSLRKLMCMKAEKTADAQNAGVGDMNDMSLVAVLKCVDKPLLLYTGDINVPAGEKLAADKRVDFKCDILKFPHHGATSWGGEKVFEALSPKIVLFPTPASIWDTPRCAAARQTAERIGAKSYSSATNDEVSILFTADGKHKVECTQNANK